MAATLEKYGQQTFQSGVYQLPDGSDEYDSVEISFSFQTKGRLKIFRRPFVLDADIYDVLRSSFSVASLARSLMSSVR